MEYDNCETELNGTVSKVTILFKTVSIAEFL